MPEQRRRCLVEQSGAFKAFLDSCEITDRGLASGISHSGWSIDELGADTCNADDGKQNVCAEGKCTTDAPCTSLLSWSVFLPACSQANLWADPVAAAAVVAPAAQPAIRCLWSSCCHGSGLETLLAPASPGLFCGLS